MRANLLHFRERGQTGCSQGQNDILDDRRTSLDGCFIDTLTPGNQGWTNCRLGGKPLYRYYLSQLYIFDRAANLLLKISITQIPQ
jgi:hypothetical protein